MTDNNKFDRFPKDFLKDITVVPHNFNAPERDEHSDYIDF